MDKPVNEWQGYTLEEIRMRRIVCMTRIELEKAKLLSVTSQYTNPKKRTASMPLLSKLTSALDYFDYASIAFTFGKRIFRLFRRKK